MFARKSLVPSSRISSTKNIIWLVSHKKSHSSTASVHHKQFSDNLPISPALTDLFGRKHNYLRVSLTERCNLRCQYCMPAEGVVLSPDASLLTLDERKTLLRAFVRLGVNKIRFTGGEPTISPQLIPLMQFCRDELQIQHLSLTTNGLKLKEQLPALVKAGLTSVNISLDTLQAKRFSEISRRPPQTISKVFSSIFETLNYENVKLKINCVVMRGVNDDELGDFVRFGHDQNVTVRFIELMPFDGNRWDLKQFVSYFEMIDLIHKQFNNGISDVNATSSHIKSNKESHIWQLKRDKVERDPHDTTKWFSLVNNSHNSSLSQNNVKNTLIRKNNSNNSDNSNSDKSHAKIDETNNSPTTSTNSRGISTVDRDSTQDNASETVAASSASVGFITSMSHNFCGGCNRVRLTADGALKTCLFGSDTVSLRDTLRHAVTHSQSGANDVEKVVFDTLTQAIDSAVKQKKEKLGGHATPVEIARFSATNRPMILIGG